MIRYKDQLTSEYKQSFLQRNAILSAAFSLLDEESKGQLDIGQARADRPVCVASVWTIVWKLIQVAS